MPASRGQAASLQPPDSPRGCWVSDVAPEAPEGLGSGEGAPPPIFGRWCAVVRPPSSVHHVATNGFRGWPVPLLWACTCVLSPWAHVAPGVPPSSPPRPCPISPQQPLNQAGLPGRREEALTWLLEKPRICSKCKQRVILSRPPPSRGVLTHLTLEGTRRGGRGCVCGYF